VLDTVSPDHLDLTAIVDANATGQQEAATARSCSTDAATRRTLGSRSRSTTHFAMLSMCITADPLCNIRL
jgi:hypothetical protein